MEGNKRAQPVQFCLNRIAYQSCRVLWTWKGLSEPSRFYVCLNRIFYQSCRVLWTWKGLIEPSLFTLLVLTGFFTCLVK